MRVIFILSAVFLAGCNTFANQLGSQDKVLFDLFMQHRQAVQQVKEHQFRLDYCRQSIDRDVRMMCHPRGKERTAASRDAWIAICQGASDQYATRVAGLSVSIGDLPTSVDRAACVPSGCVDHRYCYQQQEL